MPKDEVQSFFSFFSLRKEKIPFFFHPIHESYHPESLLFQKPLGCIFSNKETQLQRQVLQGELLLHVSVLDLILSQKLVWGTERGRGERGAGGEDRVANRQGVLRIVGTGA